MLPNLCVAHELWIAPKQYQFQNGQPIEADLRNGEDFAGRALTLYDRIVERLEYHIDGHASPIPMRAGDRPAVKFTPETTSSGRLTLAYQSTSSRITYRKFDKFKRFALEKGADWVIDAHLEAGLPQETFSESYWRYSKALLSGNDGVGQDTPVGFDIEFVVLDDPYQITQPTRIALLLLWQGNAFANARVTVFARDQNGAVTKRYYTTDGSGRAAMEISPGHEYLLDAVKFKRAKTQAQNDKAPIWQTHWAATTFRAGLP